MVHFYFFLLGSLLAAFLGLLIDRFPEQSILSSNNSCKHQLQDCRFPLPLRYWLFEGISACLFLMTSLGFLSLAQLILIMMGLTLSIYDLRDREYPLLVWLVFQLLLILTAGGNLAMLAFLLLGLLAFFWDIRMGAGDFLFLASCAAIFSLTEILLLIQIASFSGLVCFCFRQKKDRLAFVPCLLLGVTVILSYKLLLLG